MSPGLHRFFIPPEWLREKQVFIGPPIIHQIRNVLRLRPGERIVLLDNSGWEYEVELLTVGQHQAQGRVVEKRLNRSEPRTKITLYQAVLKRQNFEFVLQKGTELGVVGFVPVISERCIIAHLEDVERKRPRWKRIITEAAEQSGRGQLPLLEAALLFPQACQQAQSRGGLSIIPWEGEKSENLKALLHREPKPFSVSIFIGPEGGFTPEEIALAKRYGLIPITLGPRILRAETAGLVTATVILYEMGDLQ